MPMPEINTEKKSMNPEEEMLAMITMTGRMTMTTTDTMVITTTGTW
jgi:hypothetical protein